MQVTSIVPKIVTTEAQHIGSPVAEPPGSPSADPDWGWLPVLSFTGALGLLLLAGADALARAGEGWSSRVGVLFWGGLLMLFIPVAVRLLAIEVSRRERLGIVLLFGLGLYLVKVVQQPLAFAYHDELIHYRTAHDILISRQLFSVNPIIPISPLFPGLEIATSALSGVSGMPLFGSGVIILGLARLVLVLGLFLLYERIARSARIAGIATLVYMSNPKLIFFDAQFAYESLAIPLAVFTLCVLTIRATDPITDRRGTTVVALLGLGATVVTHHLSSYALAAFLLLWSLVHFIVGRRNAAARGEGPGFMAILAVVLILAWLTFVANLVVGYLAPSLTSSVRELARLIAGESAGRTLFRDYTGQVNPLWERIASTVATALILLGLPLGLIRLWRQRWARSIALTLAIGSLGYPLSLAFRLTEAGAESSDRAGGFLFLAVALTLAIGIAGVIPAWWRVQRAILVAVGICVFLGQIIIGAGPTYARVPGPYLVAADMRSIEPQGISAARWTLDYLGPGNRIAADRTNRLLLISYGNQRVVTQSIDAVDVSPLFFSLGFGTVQEAIVRRTGVRYILIDRRLSAGLPRVGIYYEGPEPNALRHTEPVAPAALAKFDRLTNTSRIFDSGDITIYAIGESTSER